MMWHSGTIQALAEAGYIVIALDLPGHGLTRLKDPVQIEHMPNPGEFINDVIEKLKLSNLAIVSPSMSGRYSLDFLMMHPNKLSAFIPIASATPEFFNVSKFSSTTFLSLVVWGSKDLEGKERAKKLLKMQGAIPYEIEGATHACYMDEPNVFNGILLDFLTFVHSARKGTPKDFPPSSADS